ncbi:unnamed protein product [Diatraea saccharalis]|uniref:Uncharacterized protein n=1 Tax=Diatraea saccharalis TaxID=40085 RepID=A0A9N9R9T3_9NEOP|nr:unnamed protein product [Diatraea saccharalis]
MRLWPPCGGRVLTISQQTPSIRRRSMGSPPLPSAHGAIAFALVYFTFFLDNVLLTVLVPIIPDWVRGESLALWSQHDAPLVALLNETVRRATDDAPGSGRMQAVVGLVLGAKAGAQLLAAPLCSAAVCRHGAAPVLRAATILLAAAATTLGACGAVSGGAWCVGAGRAAQGAGAAGAGVAGLALVAAATAPDNRQRALGALLGAVALGWRGLCVARRGAGGACAGAVLLTTAVMAALEPCLPLYLAEKFHPQRWQTGLVFVPDSAGYLVAATLAGGAARRLGAERVALVAQAAVGGAALALPHAPSVWWLALPHVCLGLGLGAADAALVPALAQRRPRTLPHVAALLQAASSVAYTLGTVCPLLQPL